MTPAHAQNCGWKQQASFSLVTPRAGDQARLKTATKWEAPNQSRLQLEHHHRAQVIVVGVVSVTV